MSKSAYDASILRLRGAALDSLSVIQSLLAGPIGPETVDEIMKQSEMLARNEASMVTLQQYFGENFNPPRAARPAPPAAQQHTSENNDPPVKVTEDMSPTYKRSIEKEKIKKSVRSASKKSAKKKE